MTPPRNTAAHTAGRVAYPTRDDARAGFRRARRAHRAGLTDVAPRAPWWPALPSTGELPALFVLATAPTRRDYTLAGGAR